MRSDAISGACSPCAAIAAAVRKDSGVRSCVRREAPYRRSSTSMIRRSRLGGVTSGRNSTIRRAASTVQSQTPAGAPGPPSAWARIGKASAGRGSIARAMIAESYQRPSGTICSSCTGSTPSGPSISAYDREAAESERRTLTPSRASAATLSQTAAEGGASMRKVRAQSTMRTSLAA